MKPVRSFKMKTRLATVALKSGGITVAEALKAADESLESMRGPCEESLDAALAEIHARFEPGRRDEAERPYADLAQLASRIIDSSQFHREFGLDAAARSLFQLIRLCEAQATWDWVAIDLHVNAVRLLRTSGAAINASARAGILNGLHSVTLKRVGDPNNLPG